MLKIAFPETVLFICLKIFYMNRKIKYLITTLLAALVITFFVFNNPKNTYTIGALLPLSGDNAYYGEEIQNAIELARQKINQQGGINGKQLKVLYEDDRAQPEDGVNAVHKLIDVHRVPVILGPWASSVVLATAPVSEAAKVIMMAEALAPKISEAGDYIFRIQPNAAAYTETLFASLAEIKPALKKFGIIYINNDFGIALRDSAVSAIQANGGTVSHTEGYMQDSRDFKTQLLKLRASKPDALFIAGYQEQQSIIKQAHELGFETQFLAGPPFENKNIIEQLGSLAENVIYPYHFYTDGTESTTSSKYAYLDNYRKKFGQESGGYAPLMYDATKIVAQAVAACDENTDCIKNFLYNVKFNGVSGNISFDQKGDAHLPIVIKTVKNGQFQTLKAR